MRSEIIAPSVMIVAKEGAVGDWAAYIGAITDLDYNREDEALKIASRGTKLPRRVAEFYFPEYAANFEWRD